MKSGQTVLIIGLVILLGGIIVFQQQITPLMPKPTPTVIPTPSITYNELEKLLIKEKVKDDLPQDTLQIPKDKWNEKMPALAQRVLRFLFDRGITKNKPSDEQVETYQALLGAWGKPWRTHYLMTNFDNDELQLIWDEVLLVQANTPEELDRQKELVNATLKKVQPSPELPETTLLTDHFQIQMDVNNAVQSGKLIAIQTQNIITPNNTFAVSPLADIINKSLDQKLATHAGVLEISSATRFLKLQALLKEKLGYLASKISYHTKGAAIDLKLSNDAKKRFDEYMEQQVNGVSRLNRVTPLYKRGIQLTVANLVQNGVIEKSHELTQVFAIVEQTAKEKGIEIIDETFFGVRLDKDGNVTEISPVFHLQYTK